MGACGREGKYDPPPPPPSLFIIQAVKKEYKEKDAQLDLERTFFFELDNITIDIPLKGINIEGGWKIVPLTNPVVRYNIVLE